MENRDRDEQASQTRLSAALVVQTDFENWMRLKRAAEELGCRIVFQKTAPTFAKLWIVERGREEE